MGRSVHLYKATATGYGQFVASMPAAVHGTEQQSVCVLPKCHEAWGINELSNYCWQRYNLAACIAGSGTTLLHAMRVLKMCHSEPQ